MNEYEKMGTNTSVFLRLFKPMHNEPGGNSASAITGAMGAALIGTIDWARIDSEYTSNPDNDYREIETRAQTLSTELFADAQNDLQAYKQVQKVYSLPQSSAEERVTRTQTIQSTIIRATRLSLSIARHCVQVLDLIDESPYHPSRDFSTDVSCARYLATAGLQGAIEKAEIHIDAIYDDETAIECGVEIQSLKGEIPDPYTWVRDAS